MKKIMFLFIMLIATPFLVQSEESKIKVQIPGGGFEIKTGPAEKPDEKPMVVVEKTTVIQPKGGCGCRLASGTPCK